MKRFCPHFVLPALLLLSGCELIFEQPIPPRLIGATVEMEGVDEAIAQVSAEGYWEVVSSSSWLTVEPSSGTGPTTVQLSVATAGLTPASYSGGFTTTDYETGQETFTPVIFSFPQLLGKVVEAGITALSSSEQSTVQVPTGPGRLLVGLRSPQGGFSSLSANQFRAQAAELSSVVPQASLTRTFPRSGVAVFESSDGRATAQKLLAHPDVLYVEPDVKFEQLVVNDPYRSQQWALDTIEADSAWSIATGEGSRIAIIDSGFHPGHNDLAGNVSYTYDFGDQSSQIVTTNPNCGAHGDHVAGIAAAETNNLQGIASVAFDSNLLLLDVTTASVSSCPMYTSSIVAALDWVAGDAAGRRADVVNMSIGTDVYLQSLHSAVQAAYSAGVTLVAAAGNNDKFTEVVYPAKHNEVIAVSATGPTDQIASYSVTGPEVWLSAPGGDWVVTGTSASMIYSTFTNSSGDYTYAYMEGTSMASPAVAGAAALVLSVNSSLSPSDVADILAQSSVDEGDAGRDELYGHGLLDAGAAVVLARNYIPDSMTYLVRSSDGRVLTVPADGEFDFGYTAPASLILEAMTDDDGDGTPGETGEYYGELAHPVEFDGPYDYVEIEVTEQ